MEINERFLYLRKQVLEITQEEFGKALGIARSSIASIELGNVKVTQRNIDTVCNKYNVNERWLVCGEGNIFRDLTDDEKLIGFISDVIDENALRKRFILALSKFNEEDWKEIEKLLKKLGGFCEEVFE